MLKHVQRPEDQGRTFNAIFSDKLCGTALGGTALGILQNYAVNYAAKNRILCDKNSILCGKIAYYATLM